MGLTLFHTNILQDSMIQKRLMEALIEVIDNERCGEIIDKTLVKDICKMLISVGNDSRHIYAEFFETPFLQHSTEFYQRESEKLLAENNASDYIRKVFARIHEESERAIYCFDKSTENRIIQVMEEELIRNHAKKVAEMENSGVVYMLKSKKWDDFTMMYKLFQRVPDCHLIIDDCVNEYIQEQRKGLTSENRDEEINHIRFVQNLFELKDVFEIIHKILLGDNQSVEQRIKFNFNNDINLNQHRTEYLLLVIENKLKKGVKSLDNEELVVLFKAMILLDYFKEKDFFEQYYQDFKGMLQKMMDNINENQFINNYVQVNLSID
ncbi:unnamed protein product [Rotaria sp. Silwood1]|nr:unnamed protein product [Rotaria sp. Silwood1]